MKRKVFVIVIIVFIIRLKMMNLRILFLRSGVLFVGCLLVLVDSVEFIIENFFFRKILEFFCVGKCCKMLW